MPTFLSDPAPGLYFVLGIAVIVALGLFIRYQDRKRLLWAAIPVGLFVGLFLCDTLVESPREEAVRKVRAISAAITAKSVDGFLAHVSDRFDYKGKKKADLRHPSWLEVARREGVTTAVWDFDRDRVSYPSPTEVEIVFDGKGQPQSGAPALFHFKTRFGKDPDGQYRLLTFRVYNIAKKEQGTEEIIPNFP